MEMTDISSLYQLFLRCSGVTTDSRSCPAESMFVALRGDRFDGNRYASSALQSGCSYAVVDNPSYAAEGDERYILVEDTLQTLQELARFHRRRLATPIIGITGTNGKTTTKELIAAVLSSTFPILYTQGNLNNHIGVPLTLLQLKPEHRLAVVEMGASHPGDIRELVEIAEPDYGLITNVGKAHLEGFGSFEGVVRTKGELYDYLRKSKGSRIFIHSDNHYLMEIADSLERTTYGSGENNDITGRVTGNSPFLSFEWHSAKEGRRHEVATRLIGEYNFQNALAAVAVGSYFGVEPEKIDTALAAYEPTNSRSQLKRTAANTLIIDAYNANPTSMRASILNFQKMEAAEKMLILGDMRELGAESDSEHRAILALLDECGFNDVCLVGEIFKGLNSRFRSYSDAGELAEELKRQPVRDKTILIKGSNGIHLGSIVEYL